MADETIRQPPVGPDEVAFTQARAMLEAYLQETAPVGDRWDLTPRDYASGRAILKADEPIQAAIVREGFRRLAPMVPSVNAVRARHPERALDALLQTVLRFPLPLCDEDILSLLHWLDHYHYASDSYDPLRQLTVITRCQILQYVEDYGFPPESQPLLIKTMDAKQLGELLGTARSAPLVAGRPWGTTALDALAKMETTEREAWERLLRHARTTRLTAASPRWMETAKLRLAEVGNIVFEHQVRAWFGQVEACSNAPLMDKNGDLLRGLIWMCGMLGRPTMAGALAKIAQIGYKKLPRSPILSGSMGNAAIYALSLLPGAEAAAYLGRLQLRLKHEGAQEAIERALRIVARCAEVSPETLEELLIPTFDMEEPGLLQERWGALRVSVQFSGVGGPQWSWFGKEDKPQKSVPAQVKKEYEEEWKALKETATDLQKILMAQRDRIEKLLRQEREWDLATWQPRYLDHPLLALLTRRLLWEFEVDGRHETGLWHEGRIEGATGQPLLELTDTTRVQLWHPLHQEPEAVLRWRTRLEQLEITQPFKQVHREVYLLTDAERRTTTYSNRFAAHLLNHYQFHALCQSRGWRYTLPRYNWTEEDNVPTLELPLYGLRVEFWVESLGNGEWSEYGVPLSLATDQVRFYGQDGNLLPLETIPPLVFSEVMRDVDLFVGVASVGNDPEWRDGTRVADHLDYWDRYSFGDLSVSAQTRRDAIQRLLPRLRMAGQCTVSGRFLVVRGNLRTYKIHLGSGNILMEPNDQYLCIVPDQKQASETVLLPFEGDRTLSLILSKAFLLAEDTKITDPTILSQIRSR